MIELCEIEDLLKVEQVWIDKFFDEQEDCYNILPKAGKSHLGAKRREETKKRQSEAAKGKKKSEEHARKMRETKQREYGIKINQYSIPDLKLIKTYNSLREAARETGVLKPCISSAIKRVRGHNVSGGFAWRKEGDDSEIILNEREKRKLRMPYDYGIK